MSRPLVIVGGSGHGLDTYWLAEACGYDVVGFLDDSAHEIGDRILDRPWLGRSDDWIQVQDAELVVAIGSPRIRRAVVSRLTTVGSPRFATLIHPSVTIGRFVSVAPGCMITAGAQITIDVTIGEHTIVNLNTTIAHNARLGAFVTLAPMVAISGNVRLADGVEVGTGACVRQGLAVGVGAMLGMGGVLTRELPRDELHVGNPARFMRALPPWS
ncbi:MAG: acetyltransferase [Myxococcales bacterium]|nr:acetyltransferase [Myxococcales bacterium]